MTYAPPPPGDEPPAHPAQPAQPAHSAPPAAAKSASLAKPADNAQLYGIIGIITAFMCCPPIGILFGWMSMTEARKLGKKDDSLGKVAFWAGVVATAVWLIAGVLSVCFGGFGTMSRNEW